MAPVQPGDTIMITQNWKFGPSDIFQHVWYYQHQGATEVDEDTVGQTLVEEIGGWFGTLAPYCQNTLVNQLYNVYNVTQDQPIGDFDDGYDNAGSSANPALPTQCAALVTFRTGVKKAVGRKYLPGFVNSINTTGGALSAAFLADLATWVGGVMGGVTIEGNVFKAGHYRRAYDVFVTWIIPVIDTLIRTQRRRVQGVGS